MTLLSVRGLGKTFARGGRRVTALADVDLDLAAGETLAVVGASGSGKTTLARAVLRLIEPDAGAITFEGTDWLALAGGRLRARRARMQMVFQDPGAAFNPRATVGAALADPLRLHRGLAGRALAAEIAALLDQVGLGTIAPDRSVHALSGGQRQRVAIARALASEPALVVLDEAVSALDVSVRGQILNLLADLQAARGLAYLFVSHDLATVAAVADRVAVFDAGRVVETGPVAAVLGRPVSAAARRLVAAVPRLAVPVFSPAAPAAQKEPPR
jgi:peptide/nickel transport system ATP-binding protein